VKTTTAAPSASPGIRWWGLGAGAFLAQAALTYGLGRAEDGRHLLPFLLPLAHLLLLPFLVRNLSFWGIRLVFLGLLLNLTVMLANGGLMPVEGPAVEAVGRDRLEDLDPGSPIPRSKNVLVAPGDGRLMELSDTLVLPVPKPFARAVSVGDLFVFAGVVVAYSEVIRRHGLRRIPAHDE
jgi:hypothetical protein